MASRKEEKEKLRAEREAREREAAAGARRKRLIGYAVAGALVVAALVVVVIAIPSSGPDTPGGTPEAEAAPASDFPSSSIPPARTTDLAQAARAAGCTTKSFRSEGDEHVQTPVRYKSAPAHSGDHNPIPIDDGFYLASPPPEKVVHSLEHGRILVEYNPSVSDEVKGQLGALFNEDPYHLNVVPNAKMPYELAAVAWTEIMGCKRVTPQTFDAIRAFKDRHRDRGPEFVP